MAGNHNSGNVLAFKMSDKELENALNAYKSAVESGDIPRASWANLCAYLGYTEQEISEVIAREQPQSAYYSRAVALKRALTWVRGQLASGDGWAGQNQSRAIFLPLGGIYGLFNPISVFRYRIDRTKCVICGKCAGHCDMGCDPVKNPNDPECIRCGKCTKICPTGAICAGFRDKKHQDKE